MSCNTRYIVGTSGYSFADWVGPFYPPGTRQKDMFAIYAHHFRAVELNFTFYRMDTAATLTELARNSPDDFQFWLKANRKITHEQDSQAASSFLDNLQPLKQSRKLSGVLLQFPQSFHRTIANRNYLDSALHRLSSVNLAVEFRHASWDHPASLEGLRQRQVTLVVPDCPEISALYRPQPAITTATGYLRLHSRNPAKWHAGLAQRYDYNYSDQELTALAAHWSSPDIHPRVVFAFFNNCHLGQAARNAQAFTRILARLSAGQAIEHSVD